jgi:hypothetical protein
MDGQSRRQFLQRGAAAGLIVAGLPVIRSFDVPAFGWAGSPPVTPPTNGKPPPKDDDDDDDKDSDPPDGKDTDPPDGKGTDPPDGKGTDPPDGKGTDPPDGKDTDPPDGKDTDDPPTVGGEAGGQDPKSAGGAGAAAAGDPTSNADTQVLGAQLSRSGATSSLPFTGGDPRRLGAIGAGAAVAGAALLRGRHRGGSQERSIAATEPRIGYPVRQLRRVVWNYETAPLAAFDFTFRVRVTDAALGAYIERLVAPFAAPGGTQTERWVSLRDRGPEREPRFAAYIDDTLVAAGHDRSVAIAAMLSAIDRAAVASVADDRLLVHAAAASTPDGAVLLLGPSGAGKTTMVAALIRSGFGYVADEIVAFDHASTTAQPYQKAITLKAGSRFLFPDVRDALGPPEGGPGSLWHVPVDALRSQAGAAAAPVRSIVELRYHADAATAIEPIAERDALAAIVANCFNGDRLDEHGFATASKLATVAPAHRLVFSDLATACTLVRDTLRRGQ